MRVLLFFLLATAVPAAAYAQSKYPAPAEGDYKVKDFIFESKEVLPELVGPVSCWMRPDISSSLPMLLGMADRASPATVFT